MELRGEQYSVYVNVPDFTIRIHGKENAADSVRIDLSQMARRLNDFTGSVNVPPDSMTTRAEGSRLKVMLVASQLQYMIDSAKFNGTSIEADLLLGVK